MRTTDSRRLALMALALLWCGAASALPVIPDTAGFGIDTPAGRGGKVIKVTNLQASGAGSLKACVDASGPRVCVFEVSGTIRLTQNLRIYNPNITIAGQTAPAPGIMLRGAALSIRASDVLVQHIAVRVGDAAEGHDPSDRDALYISSTSTNGGIRNIVVANCSFSWSVDEMISAWANINNVSLINNIFAEPLHDSIHPKTAPIGNGVGHGYAMILGPHRGRISLVGNLFAHSIARHPLSDSGEFVMVNNVIYNSVNRGVQLRNGGGFATLNAIVGNVFIPGPDSKSSNNSIELINGLLTGSKLYVRDNFSPLATSDPWSIVKNSSTLSRSLLEAKSAPSWPSGLSSVSSKAEGVVDWVLSTAGSRPAKRDVVDARIVREVTDRKGGFVNCVASDGSSRCARNGGGWPNLAESRRQFVVPPSPNSDDNGNGYTNLEELLHEMAREVEGRNAEQPPPKAPKPVVVE